MKAILLAACTVALGGCAQDLAELNREPALSRVGSGLSAPRDAIPSSLNANRPVDVSFNAIYNRQSEDLFRDNRAMKVGDVVTVRIAIKDKAKLDNNTDRSRNSVAKFGLDFLAAFGSSTPSKASLNGNIDSETSSRGKGQTDRSEEVDLSIAAVVTEILPNGNLMINGSQEVRVNYDMRVLNIAGMVRPRDITGMNTISYEKIAEARISYGGRGRAMEVQQPGWGHQIYDKVSPF
jgi:flagellar L-ring protein precursor FlgH